MFGPFCIRDTTSPYSKFAVVYRYAIFKISGFTHQSSLPDISKIVQIFKQMYCINCGEDKLSTAICVATLSSICMPSFSNPTFAISFRSFTSHDSILIMLNRPERSAFLRIASSALWGKETTIALNPLRIASLSCCAICIRFSSCA